MATVTNEQLLSALNWRYATKKFDPTRKIDAQTWATLESALVLSPSSFGLQPWKFIVVENPALREQLVSASWGQRQVADASHFVVFTLKKDIGEAHVKHYIERMASVQGKPVEALAPFENVVMGSLNGANAAGRLNVWQSRQVYVALGQFMAAAAMLGVDTCPMEGIDPAKYDELLGLTGTGYETLCACPAGYRAEDDKYASAPKVRFPADEVVTRL